MKETPGSVDTVLIELFVQGQSARSNEALDVVRRVCDLHLQGRYCLEVIDIQQHPDRTRAARVMAAPALVRRHPEPVLRTVGQLTEIRVLQGLGLATLPGETEGA